MFDLLNQTITLYTKSALNEFGHETYGAGSSVQCRFQKKTRTKILPNNEVVTTEAVVYLMGSVTVEQGDKVTYNGVDYKVFSKSEAIDGEGNIHNIKLELTKWQQ